MNDPPQSTPPAPEEAALPAPNHTRALRWITALAAADIPYRLRQEDGVWVIHVPLDVANYAEHEILFYEQANANWPPAPATVADAPLLPDSWWAGLPFAGALVAADLLRGTVFDHLDMLACGKAAGPQILQGEWWRTITALTLHLDIPHLMGNVIAGLFLLGGVAAWLGWGVALLLVLCAGASANALASLALGDGFHAAGASTAVFAALGMLGALQFAHNYRRFGSLRTIWHRSWVAGCAALACLAALGTGPRSDLTGHALGFACGALLAAFPAWRKMKPPGNITQAFCAALTLALVFLAWKAALG